MAYCDCDDWYIQEKNPDKVIDFDKLRKEGNFCPFCGKPLIKGGDK